MYKKILVAASALLLNNIQSSSLKFAVAAGPVARFGNYKIKGFDTKHDGDFQLAGKTIGSSKDKEQDFTLKSKTGYFAGRFSAHVGALSVAGADVFARVFADFGNHKSYLNDKHTLIKGSGGSGNSTGNAGGGVTPVIDNSGNNGGGNGGNNDDAIKAAAMVSGKEGEKPTNVGSDTHKASSILERQNIWRVGFGPEATFCVSDSMNLSVSAGPLFANLKQTLTTEASSYSKSCVQYGGFVSVIGRMFFGEENNFFAYGEAMGTFLASKDLKSEKVTLSGAISGGSAHSETTDITFKHAKSFGGNVSVGVGYYHHA